MMVLIGLMEAVLLVGGVIYLLTCLFAFHGHLRADTGGSGSIHDVSVIIPARDEARHIGLLLDDLDVQDYPRERFEIVVVDDRSCDATSSVVRSRAENDPRIQLVDTTRPGAPYSHKKRALHEGIRVSRGSVIVTVDADCRVASGWLTGMVGRLADGVDLVAGEVHVEGRGLVAWFEALEFTGIQAMASGLMNAGFPITCNGANLAYRREAFERVGGFGDIGSVVSGDDDLLMQKMAGEEPSRVVFATGPSTAVRTAASTSLGEFLSRRARWASKILHYPSAKAVALLVLIFMFFLAVPVWFVFSMAGGLPVWPLLAGYGMKAAGDLLLAGYGLLHQGRSRLLSLFPVAELAHVPYIIGVTLHGAFGSFEWRGRRTGTVNTSVMEVTAGD